MAGVIGGGALEVGGTKLIDFGRFVDDRGLLIVGDSLPFAVRRIFTVQGVPAGADRGVHAHRECAQLLVCLQGSVEAVVDDGRGEQVVLLDDAAVALHMPALTWGTQRNYSADAVLLVLASHVYDVADYIDDYREFQTLAGVAP